MVQITAPNSKDRLATKKLQGNYGMEVAQIMTVTAQKICSSSEKLYNTF
jgi:hypothetical protein